MNTIMILAKALAEAARADIARLDIQYNSNSETYSGRVWLTAGVEDIFDIHENGTITLPQH